MLLGWRATYAWLVQQPYFRERVYVLGTGDRAQRVRDGLRQRPELGIEVVGWTGQIATGGGGSPKELEEIGESGDRLAGRFEWGPATDIQRPDLGTKVAILQREAEQETESLPDSIEGELTRDAVANHLLGLVRENGVHRVIVAMPDRRGHTPGGRVAEVASGRSEGGRSHLLAGKDLPKNRSGEFEPQLADFRRRLPLQSSFSGCCAGC